MQTSLMPATLQRLAPLLPRRACLSHSFASNRAHRARFTPSSRSQATMSSGQSRADLQTQPGVRPRDSATQGFVFQQTMLRVRDPVKSLEFYTGVMGMTLLCKLDYADMKFSLYFLGMVDDPSEIPDDPVERAKWMFGRVGCLELTHNWGTEMDPSFKGYHNGNTPPVGFGHIGFCVPSVEAACKRFEELGVEFVKRPNDGKMKNLAFIADPDGYRIEILEQGNADNLVNWPGNKQE